MSNKSELRYQCVDCGENFRVKLKIPERLWREIAVEDLNVILCGGCIIKRVEGIAISGELRVQLADLRRFYSL